VCELVIAQGFQDVFSTQIQVPPLPAKAQFSASPAQPAASRMPGSAADVEGSLGYSERQRVTREREEAAELEKKAQTVRWHDVLRAVHLFSLVMPTRFFP